MPNATPQNGADACFENVVKGGIVVRGRWLRTASLRDEWYEDPTDPEAIVAALKSRAGVADLFTFVQRLPDVAPQYPYFCEQDNVAAIPISTFEHWLKEQIPKSTRKHARRAGNNGVIVRRAEFSDDLVRQIATIYNETPLRGGMPFTHYGEDFEKLKRSHATFLDRSDFIGAFLGEELIGFIKLTYAGQTARSMQIIAKIAHRDKWPTNALLMKSVEVCAEKGIAFLVYGKLEYGKKGSEGLAAFKRENGFEKFEIPRYFIPLTLKGRCALNLRLQHGVVEWLPRSAVAWLRNLKVVYYTRKYQEPPRTKPAAALPEAVVTEDAP